MDARQRGSAARPRVGLGRARARDTAGARPGAASRRRDGAQPRRRVGGVDGPQQAVAVRADGDRQRLPRRRVLGEPGQVEPGAVALGPRVPPRRQVRAQPVRRHGGQRVERVAQRLAHALSRFSTRTAASTCVESVRWRPRALSRPAARQRASNASSSDSATSPATSRARNSLKHRGIEPRVGQLQPQEVLPVDPAPHRVGRRAVRRGPRRTAAPARGRGARGPRRAGPARRTGREGLIRIDRAQLVAQPQVDVAFGKGRARDAGGALGDGASRAGDARTSGAPRWQRSTPSYVHAPRTPASQPPRIRQQCRTSAHTPGNASP